MFALVSVGCVVCGDISVWSSPQAIQPELWLTYEHCHTPCVTVVGVHMDATKAAMTRLPILQTRLTTPGLPPLPPPPPPPPPPKPTDPLRQSAAFLL